MATAISRRLGAAAKKLAGNKGSGWYNPHMAAAFRAIDERLPLADLILEIRDARIPLSSKFEQLRNYPSSRRIIVMNKMDLANRLETKEWVRYFEQQNCIAYGVNSHNKENIKEFLNFIQARVRELGKTDRCHSSHTTTILLVGIPNVGKSALANSLHQIGRISAAEKGKLKHTTISPLPGETKDISSLKIASHPNIYVLDTPGILPPEIFDAEFCFKLALTGAIKDCMVGEEELSQTFLAILNLSDQYKKWEKFCINENDTSFIDHKADCSGSSDLDAKRKRQFPTDHTQDFIVNGVRGTLFEAISSFGGDVQDEKDLERLIKMQLIALQKALHVREESDEQAHSKVATKLLNLYRTGRLGHYTLDPVPRYAL